MEALGLLIVLVYMFYAKKKNKFPFDEEKKGRAFSESEKSLDKYDLMEIRRMYYMKLAESVKLTPDILKMEQDFGDLVNKVNQLVHMEYPHSVWHFQQKNVGSSIVLNRKIAIDILTFDGLIDNRYVLLENRVAIGLEPLVYEKEIPAETKEETKKTEETQSNQSTIEEYVQEWFEINYDYIEHLREVALENGNNSILVEKEKYEADAENAMCDFFVEKYGFETSSCTENGIVASMYIAN